MNNKLKGKYVYIIISFLIVVVLGISFAFFNYTRSGNEKEIVVGKIYMHYNTSRNLPLVNVEPRNALDPNMYIEFTVDGLNEYQESDIWYGIDILYGDVPVDRLETNRIRDDLLRFTLMKKIDDGEFEKVIDDRGYPSINELRMYVETIPKNTTTEKRHTYRLYAWISDTISVGNVGNPSIDYTMEEWNNLFGSIRVRILGDFIEKTNEDGIKVNFDANGGSVSTPVKYYNEGDMYGSLPIPIKEGYAFDGWELDNNIVQTTDIVNSSNIFHSVSMYKYIGATTFNGNNYIDTGIKLFNQDNYQRNFYVTFEIKSREASQTAQAVLMGANDEAISGNPGMFFRISGNNYQLSTRSPNGDINNIPGDTEKVEVLRINKTVYYRLNGEGGPNLVKNMNSFTNYHNLPVSFGAGIKNNAIFRGYKGTLSNMLVEFIDDNATLDNYENYIHNDFESPGNYFNNEITLRAKWIVDKMNTFPTFITDKKEEIKRIVFKKENETDLARYNAISDAALKGDIGTEGSVKAWLELDNTDNLYTLYVESETATFLTTGQNLFNGYKNVTEIDLSNVDTSNVSNMTSMFQDCSSLTSLDVTNFNTSVVTTMQNMFIGCGKLTSLELSNFNTSKVTTMRDMFNGCSNLTSLDLSSFNTSAVTNMQSMFYGCGNLTSLDLSSFNTSKVTRMVGMFNLCGSLTSLDLSSFNTSLVTNMYQMFNGCNSLTSLDLSSFNTSDVTNMQDMFKSCSSLTSLDVSHFNTSAVTNMQGMFHNCSSLTSLDVSHFNTGAVTTMQSMFQNCSNLTSLDVSKFNTGAVTIMGSMFWGCSSLTSLDVSKFDTSKVTTMNHMFGDCQSLTSLDLKNFNTNLVIDMDGMFIRCYNLTHITLDEDDFDTSSVTKMSSMFSGCSSLIEIDVSHFNTSAVTNMYQMFNGCSSLTSLNLSNFNTSAVTNMQGMFSGCSSLTTLDLSNFDVSNVTVMKNVFQDCSSLVILDLSGFETSQVTDMGTIFSGCTNLETIYVSSLWNVDNVTNDSGMFNRCTSLVGKAPNTTYAYNGPTGKTYAKIATDSEKGYLTDISLKPSA